VPVSLTLAAAVVAMLDQLRGESSRSAHVERLIRDAAEAEDQ
jgi:hypothetical protein